MLPTPKRIDEPELLDEHDAPRADMERSLRDLQRINRWLGGVAVYTRLLARFGRPRSILDLGTGTSDLLAAVDVPLRIGLDFKIDHLLYSRRPDGIRRVVGDATRLPFRDGSVDVVTSAHFFHHFTADENVAILRSALAVSRLGVVVNDTRRHFAPLAFVHLIGALRLVGRITRYDAPASVRRAYTIGEAEKIAAATGASRHAVMRAFPFRFGILLWK